MTRTISVTAILISMGVGLLCAGTSMGRPLELAGTSWLISPTRINCRVSGFGRVLQRQFGELTVTFGENGGLGPGRVRAVDGEGGAITGNYTVSRRGRVSIDWDDDVLQNFIANKIETVSTATNVTVELLRERTRVNLIWRRNRLNLVMVFGYQATGMYNGEQETARGWYQVRGFGGPVPSEPSDF